MDFVQITSLPPPSNLDNLYNFFFDKIQDLKVRLGLKIKTPFIDQKCTYEKMPHFFGRAFAPSPPFGQNPKECILFLRKTSLSLKMYCCNNIKHRNIILWAAQNLMCKKDCSVIMLLHIFQLSMECVNSAPLSMPQI